MPSTRPRRTNPRSFDFWYWKAVAIRSRSAELVRARGPIGTASAARRCYRDAALDLRGRFLSSGVWSAPGFEDVPF